MHFVVMQNKGLMKINCDCYRQKCI